MSWSARIHHTEDGLAITFAEPLSRLTMTPSVAQHFARLLAAEAAKPCTPYSPAIPASSSRRSAGNTQTVHAAHALQCDCDTCLNGDES